MCTTYVSFCSCIYVFFLSPLRTGTMFCSFCINQAHHVKQFLIQRLPCAKHRIAYRLEEGISRWMHGSNGISTLGPTPVLLCVCLWSRELELSPAFPHPSASISYWAVLFCSLNQTTSIESRLAPSQPSQATLWQIIIYSIFSDPC